MGQELIQLRLAEHAEQLVRPQGASQLGRRPSHLHGPEIRAKYRVQALVIKTCGQRIPDLSCVGG
jgi:hypothetical protein